MMAMPSGALTRGDFDRCGWQEVTADCEERACWKYSGAFFTKAREAEESGDTTGREVFGLLGAVTSLLLQPDSREQPFIPMLVTPQQRSASVDDFTDAHLDFFAALAPDAADPEIRARLADVLWVRRRDFRIAGLAVEAYLESARTLERTGEWADAAARVERALRLAAMLDRGARKARYFPAAVAHIEAILGRCGGGDDRCWLMVWLMDLLLEHREGDPARYAPLAEGMAGRATAAGKWHYARAFRDLAARWHRRAGNAEAERAALLAAAETYVGEAEAALAGTPPGHLAAAQHLSSAIEALRRVGGAAERVAGLHRRLLELQEAAIVEMRTVALPPRDLTDLVRLAEHEVEGHTLHGALLALAFIGPPTDPDDLRQHAEKLARAYPYRYLMPWQVVNSVGKVVARSPALLAQDLAAVEVAMRNVMFEQAQMRQAIHATAIGGAIRRVALQHNVREGDLLAILRDNPFVPPGRERIFARGLLAGLYGDYLLSTHLLIPQVENSIRHLLRRHGVVTSGLDDEGIQDEYSLNTTLAMPETEELLGRDIAFDLRGLLVERYGSNLRNRMAHGLLDHDEYLSPQAVYLWWLVLRICFTLLFKLALKRQSSAEGGSEAMDMPSES